MSTWRTKHIGDKKAKRAFEYYHGFNPCADIPPRELKYWGWNSTDAERLENLKGVLGSYRKTRKPCSRLCCGNPRNHLGNSKESRTLQERKKLSSMKEEMEEYANW